MCDIGFSFLIWKMGDWTHTHKQNSLKFLWAVRVCGSLSYLVSASCPKPESVLQDPGGGWAGDLEPERRGGWVVMAPGLMLQALLGLPAGLAPAPFPATGLPKQPAITCYCSVLSIWPGGCRTLPRPHLLKPPPLSTIDLLVW